jgi:predicted acetyltransferase
MVTNSTFWLVDDDEIIAVSHLRHVLNDSLRHMGGHIGLGVRPSYRGKGVSKKLLKLTMQEAKKRDIDKLHIHCYKNNLASVNMIKACGGLLDTELHSDEGNTESPIVQKYILKEF